MVFADNSLKISFKGGGSIEFNALDAIKCISNKADESIKVAHAKTWTEARFVFIVKIFNLYLFRITLGFWNITFTLLKSYFTY